MVVEGRGRPRGPCDAEEVVMDTSTMVLTEDELGRLVALRHDLHEHPELSGQERETTARIREFLAGIPECEIVELPVETGVVVRIAGTADEVMLRADIDALPQTERVDVPWRSGVEGVMHACGHDVHAAALAMPGRERGADVSRAGTGRMAGSRAAPLALS